MLGDFVTTDPDNMRAALLIVLGLAIGILGTVPVMNILNQRNPMPKAVMITMGYHMHQLQDELKAKRCDATASLGQLQHMQAIAGDIPAAFPNTPKAFEEDTTHLQQALGAAVQAAPADCPALAVVLKPVGHACQSCHQAFR